MVGSKHGGFKFTVKTGLRSLTMAAKSAEMREEWTLAIRKLVQLIVSESSVKELSSTPVASARPGGAKQISLRRRKPSVAGLAVVGTDRNTCSLESSAPTASTPAVQLAAEVAAAQQDTVPNTAKASEATTESWNALADGRGEWIKVNSPEGTYYYHKKTRVSRWDKPDEFAVAAVASRVEEMERTADLAFQVFTCKLVVFISS